MKSVPLPRIGMRVVKTAVAVMLSYTIFVPFGLIYNCLLYTSDAADD